MAHTRSPPVTLAHVLQRISADETLARDRRIKLRSSLNAVSRLIGLPLSNIPAEPAVLRERLQRAHHSHIGVGRRQLIRVRSDLLVALERTGAKVLRSSRNPLSPLWLPYYDKLPTLHYRMGLSRFMRFCDDRGIAPEDVSDDISDEFKVALEQRSLVSNYRFVYRNSCRLWNKATQDIDGWPQRRLTVPASRSGTWEQRLLPLPASVWKELDRYLAWYGSEGNEGNRRNLASSTLNNIRSHVRGLASSLAESGHDLGNITCLADLVAVDRVKEAIRHRARQRDGPPTEYDAGTIGTACRIARDWLKSDEGEVAELRDLRRRLNPRRYGLREKNLTALRQFRSEQNLRAILGLPNRLMHEASLGRRGIHRPEVTAQKALAIELLLSAPMYLGDLVRLRTDRSIQYLEGASGPMCIVIPESQSVTHHKQVYMLSQHSRRLVIEYLLRFLPEVRRGSTPWLFPGRAGDHKDHRTLRVQIQKAIFEHTGLTLTPRQFRHLAAKLILDAEPGAFELVRQLLGYRKLHNVRHVFGHFETEHALRQYDELIARLTQTVTHTP